MGAESRPGQQRPFGLPNLAQDGVGGSGGNGRLRLLSGNRALGEPIEKKTRPGARRQPEQAKPTLGQEINAYLAERARLRAEGKLPTPEGKPPIVTSADAISLDLLALEITFIDAKTETTKSRSVRKIRLGFNDFAFGALSHDVREYTTNGYELMYELNRDNLKGLEELGRLDGEQTAILAEQLQKVGLPQPRPGAITIPLVPTVAGMRKIVGGEALFSTLPPANVTSINDHPRRNR